MAYYQAIDCYSAPARSMYNESEYFVKVYWSVDGVNEMDMDEVEVYPNPASATAWVKNVEPTVIQVYNTLGQLVKTVRGTNEINVAGLPEGVYVLRITDEKGNAFTERVSVGR